MSLLNRIYVSSLALAYLALQWTKEAIISKVASIPSSGMLSMTRQTLFEQFWASMGCPLLGVTAEYRVVVTSGKFIQLN